MIAISVKKLHNLKLCLRLLQSVAVIWSCLQTENIFLGIKSEKEKNVFREYNIWWAAAVQRLINQKFQFDFLNLMEQIHFYKLDCQHAVCSVTQPQMLNFEYFPKIEWYFH